MKILAKSTPTTAVLLCALLVSRPAAAQNTVAAQFLPQDPADITSLTLTPGEITLSGSPDQYQFTFSGTLLNTNASEVFLNGADLSFTGSGIDPDASPFATFPLSLAPNTGSSGPLFTLTETGLVSPGTYYGSFSVLGGADGDAYDALAVQPFEVQVTAPPAVPEASTTVSFGLLVLGLGGLTVRARRRTVRAAA